MFARLGHVCLFSSLINTLVDLGPAIYTPLKSILSHLQAVIFNHGHIKRAAQNLLLNVITAHRDWVDG